MTRAARPLRLAVVTVMSSLLALVVGAHGLSSASTKASSALATQVYPFNWHAIEEKAYDDFQSEVQRSAIGRVGSSQPRMGPAPSRSASAGSLQLQTAIRPLVPQLKNAVRHEPLLPRAYALLALADTDQRQRLRLLEQASAMSRRSLLLQGLVLDRNVTDGNYAGTIETIDQILRVEPSRSDVFYPILTQALAYDETVPLFADVLDDEIPWRQSYLAYAVNDPKALNNLNRLRRKIDFRDEAFDQQLIAGLVAQGQIVSAAELYEVVTRPQGGRTSVGGQSWTSGYPPFDWQLANERGRRAQPTSDLSALEILIQSGNGGVLAQRLIKAPPMPLIVSVAGAITPKTQLENLNVTLTCFGQSEPFFEQGLATGTDRFVVRERPSDCSFLYVGLSGRSWSGAPAIRGTISSIEISSNAAAPRR